MAPRTRSKSRTSDNASVNARSTAQIFLNPDQLEKETKKTVVETPTATQTEAEDDDNDAPENYNFPLNYIFMVQDFLNENLTTGKFIQVMTMGYLCQIIYLYNQQLVLDNYQVVGFNVAGIVVSLILAYSSKKKNHLINPAVYAYPELPDFNHFYSVFIPLMLTLLFKPENLLLNLSLNYFIVDNLPIALNVFASIMFSYIYDSDQITIQTCKQIAVFTFLRMFIKNINEEFPQEDDQHMSKEQETDEDDEDDSENEDSDDNDETDDSIKVVTKEPIKPKVSMSNAECHLITLLLSKILIVDSTVNSLNNDPYLAIVILKSLLISLIFALVPIYPVFKLYKTQDESTGFAKLLAIFISGASCLIIYLTTNYQLSPILGKDPIPWLLEYIFANQNRIRLITIWASVSIGLITFVFTFADKFSLNWRRKVWHFALFGVLFFTNGLTQEPVFTLISIVGIFFIMLIVEIIRYNKFTIIGKTLHTQLRLFQDTKDLQGPLNLSYIFLLTGTVIPIFINNLFLKQDISQYSFIGLIFLGVGDSFASIVGQKLGKNKWRGSNKTIEGSIGFFMSTLVSFSIIHYFYQIEVDNWESMIVCCLIGCLLEGSAEMNDNLLIPMYGFISLYALNSKPESK